MITVTKTKHTFGRWCYTVDNGKGFYEEIVQPWDYVVELCKSKGINLPKTFKATNPIKKLGGWVGTID